VVERSKTIIFGTEFVLHQTERKKQVNMKNIVLFLSLMVGSLTIKAQTGNLVIFSDDGSKFFVVVNGLRVNDQAQTNVRVTGLNADYVSCKVVFENELTPDIVKKTLMLAKGHEVTYKIKKNNKGETVCNWYSDVELAQAPTNSANQQTVIYSNVPYNDGTVIRTGNGTTSTNTTTTTTTGNNGTVNANVGVGGVGMNVTIYDGTGTVSGTSSTTTTTTTTYSSTNTTDATNTNYNNNCIYGMSNTDLNAAKNSMNSTSFDDTRVTTFKQIVSSKCIITSQVKELLQLFSFEDNKLDMAKYAYAYVADPSNYYTINDIFTFDSNKSELSTYVTNNQRR
jgi:hypothetical protein